MQARAQSRIRRAFDSAQSVRPGSGMMAGRYQHFSTTQGQEHIMKQQSFGADSSGAAAAMAAGNGTAADTEQSGVAREYHAFVSDVEDMISSATSLTGEDLARAKARLSARISAARASIVRAGSAVSEQVRSGARATDGYVRAQPWQAVGISAAAGILLGYLLGRRSS
jgi:ElaB/YqjD/DUF883 family membrane-anchored ribosome-binding protein